MESVPKTRFSSRAVGVFFFQLHTSEVTMKCLECNCELDEDFDEVFHTEDGDGPFCEDCIEEVEADRAQVLQAA